MNETTEILALARELAIDHFKPGKVREIGFRSGAYDNGSDVTRFVAAAEAELIRRRTENTEAE